MSKLCWCCAACLVVGGGIVYLAAEYANRHPDSCLGQCFSTTSYQTVTCEGCSGLLTCVEQAVKTAKEVGATMMSDPPCPEVQCPSNEGPCPGKLEVSEPIQVNVPGPAGDCQVPPPCQSVPGAMVDPSCGAATAGAATGAVIGASYEESEAVEPGSRPPCQAAGKPACQAAESESVPSMPGCSAIETEDVPYMSPTPDEDDASVTKTPHVQEDSEMPKEEEDALFPFHIWMNWLKKDQAREGDAHEESELVPVPGVGDPPMPEGMQPVGPNDPPRCEEDPNYDHQYSGCPYMGGCPSGHCPPQRDCPEPCHIKKKNDIKAKPTSKVHKANFWQHVAAGTDECCGTTDVDTMECRPSDAQKTGFDPRDPF